MTEYWFPILIILLALEFETASQGNEHPPNSQSKISLLSEIWIRIFIQDMRFYAYKQPPRARTHTFTHIYNSFFIYTFFSPVISSNIHRYFKNSFH